MKQAYQTNVRMSIVNLRLAFNPTGQSSLQTSPPHPLHSPSPTVPDPTQRANPATRRPPHTPFTARPSLAGIDLQDVAEVPRPLDDPGAVVLPPRPRAPPVIPLDRPHRERVDPLRLSERQQLLRVRRVRDLRLPRV